MMEYCQAARSPGNSETDPEDSATNTEESAGEFDLSPEVALLLRTLEAQVQRQAGELARLTRYVEGADELLGAISRAVDDLQERSTRRSPLAALSSLLRTVKWSCFTVRRGPPNAVTPFSATEEGRPG